MKTRRIGSLEVSVVGLGTNNLGTDFFGKTCDQEQATQIINAALDAGITLVDTAEEYSVTSALGVGRSEQVIGVALGSRRDEVVIASKFSNDDAEYPEERGAKRVVRAVEASLKRLGTDRIDLYQQHQPDPRVPVDEMLEALDRLVRDGKVREIGCCNFSGAMIDEALAASDAGGFGGFACVQDQYNMLDVPMQDGVIEACKRHGLMFLPYFPLASGVLTGKYGKGAATPTGSRFDAETRVTSHLRTRQLSDDRIAKVQRLEVFAQERGHTMIELAMSWLASQPFIASVIAGASTPEQIRANAAAANWDLTAEDFDAVAAILA